MFQLPPPSFCLCRVFELLLPFDLGGELSLDLGSSLVVIGQIARLAHAHGVQLSVSMSTLGGVLISAVLSIARWTHVLGVVLAIGVRTLSDLHLWLGAQHLLFRVFFHIRLGEFTLTIWVVIWGCFWAFVLIHRNLHLDDMLGFRLSHLILNGVFVN